MSGNFTEGSIAYTPYNLISVNTTNATSLKGGSGRIGYIVCGNINAAQRYLKLYDKATAPTVGTDIPVQTIPIPGNTAGAGVVLPVPMGIEFKIGIAFALTAGITVADTTAVAASEITVNIGYK